MIVKAKVIETYNVMLRCDHCGKIMKHKGYDGESMKYRYGCECGYEEMSKICYPFQKATIDLSSEKEITEEEALSER